MFLINIVSSSNSYLNLRLKIKFWSNLEILKTLISCSVLELLLVYCQKLKKDFYILNNRDQLEMN